METKHTPGPWRWKGEVGLVSDSEGLNYATRNVIEACDGCVYSEYSRDGAYLDVSKANARLIAAAPDLLEALREAKGLADMAEMYDGPGEPSNDQKSLVKLRGMIDAAIAKATQP